MSSVLFKFVLLGGVATAVAYFRFDHNLARQVGGATGLIAFCALLAKFWDD